MTNGASPLMEKANEIVARPLPTRLLPAESRVTRETAWCCAARYLGMLRYRRGERDAMSEIGCLQTRSTSGSPQATCVKLYRPVTTLRPMFWAPLALYWVLAPRSADALLRVVRAQRKSRGGRGVLKDFLEHKAAGRDLVGQYKCTPQKVMRIQLRLSSRRVITSSAATPVRLRSSVR